MSTERKYHQWDWREGSGETCIKCGDKDWMADSQCNESKLKKDEKESKFTLGSFWRQFVFGFTAQGSPTELFISIITLSLFVGPIAGLIFALIKD